MPVPHRASRSWPARAALLLAAGLSLSVVPGCRPEIPKGYLDPCEEPGDCGEGLVCESTYDTGAVSICRMPCRSARDCPEKYDCRYDLCTQYPVTY